MADETTREKNIHAQVLGRLGGVASGGMRRRTPEERHEIAMLGVAARRKKRDEKARQKAQSFAEARAAAERRHWLVRFEADNSPLSPDEIARLNEAIRRRSQAKIIKREATG